jgi:hypothetical protein
MNRDTYKRAMMIHQMAEIQVHIMTRCAGIDCSNRHNCQRFSSFPNENEQWASFYSDLPDCGAFIPMKQAAA